MVKNFSSHHNQMADKIVPLVVGEPLNRTAKL
jgi:hypothetical protein